jgi:hypothetical protein
MTNGMPVTVTKAAEELRKYRHGLKVMSGGLACAVFRSEFRRLQETLPVRSRWRAMKRAATPTPPSSS